MADTMIVKIQRPLDSSQEKPPALVYNKNRTYTTFAEFSDELRELMGERLKVYCEAEIDGEHLALLGEVEGESW